MLIESLEIPCFRNLQSIVFSPDQGTNVICGPNGQGKTNILECLWMFTGGKSFTGATPKEMIPFDADFAQAKVSYFFQGRSNKASFLIANKISAEVNGVAKKGFSSLAGGFLSVIFSPEHLALVKGGPDGRRQGLDVIICQLKPRYITLLSQYNRLLSQRNALLKLMRNGEDQGKTLLEWDMALASAGALLTKTRKSYALRLFPIAQSLYTGISAGRERVALRYLCWANEQEITAQLLFDQLQLCKVKDLAIGATSCGPHRDDIEILLDARSARSFASQGQQRSIVLSLKIAECDLIEEITGERPVILLDDVMSELDETRRRFLLHHLGNRQIFITCCDQGQLGDTSHVIQIQGGRMH